MMGYQPTRVPKKAVNQIKAIDAEKIAAITYSQHVTTKADADMTLCAIVATTNSKSIRTNKWECIRKNSNVRVNTP